MTDINHRRPRWRGAAMIVLTVVSGMLIAGVAGAATGIFPVGSEIEGGSDSENAHEHGHDNQQVVARGTSPVAGPWRLTALRHPADENSPEGDCLQLLLTEPPKDSPISATILCQDVGESALKMDTMPVIDTATGKSEILLFGSSPAATESVELTADGKALQADTSETPAGFNGRPWVIVVPSGHKTGHLTSVRQDGARQATVDTSRYFDQLAIWDRNLN